MKRNDLLSPGMDNVLPQEPIYLDKKLKRTESSGSNPSMQDLKSELLAQLELLAEDAQVSVLLSVLPKKVKLSYVRIQENQAIDHASSKAENRDLSNDAKLKLIINKLTDDQVFQLLETVKTYAINDNLTFTAF